MWLLETESLQLHQINDSSDETYAILSHTWDLDHEISFQDIQDLGNARVRPGFEKIRKTCDIARSKGYKYVWIDTCCIDKSSSAELSEAINSMFRWYKDSHVCYVYLSDFEPLSSSVVERERVATLAARLEECRWFTRGWTLQELIAPQKMEFFDRDWNFLGGKGDLEGDLFRLTNIDVGVLGDSSRLHTVPAGRKMSWAAARQTTRIEDRAYSLLGIFDINMPLLYGEGSKAFFRLQQQIANASTDLSLFAWQRADTGTGQRLFSGIFADSLDDFRTCSTLKKHPDQSGVGEFAITNAGLRIQDDLLRVDPSNHQYLLPLHCVQRNLRTGNGYDWMAVPLVKIGDRFLRRDSCPLVTASSRLTWTPVNKKQPESTPKNIYIQTVLRSSDAKRLVSLQILHSRIVILYGPDLVDAIGERSGLPEVSCPRNTMAGAFIFYASGYDNFLAVLSLRIRRWKQAERTSRPESRKSADNESHETVAVVCTLQWIDSSFKLRFGLFDTREITGPQHRQSFEQEPSKKASPSVLSKLPFTVGSGQPPGSREMQVDLDQVKDMLLVKYSDISGLLIQDAMPTLLQATLLGRHGVLIARPLEQEDERNLPSRPAWQHGDYRILLEHRLQSRTKRNT